MSDESLDFRAYQLWSNFQRGQDAGAAQRLGRPDVLTLLTLFRKHLLYYVYASDSQFAEVMRAELPSRRSRNTLVKISDTVVEFRADLAVLRLVIVINGHEIYVYEHIYESIRQLPENRAGGVWLPDELSRFLQKAKQYRDRFTDSEEKYFKQVQVWGKSIAETKSKFYALREIFMREKRRMRRKCGSGLECILIGLRELTCCLVPVKREKEWERSVSSF
ncbi:hypothetical protein GQ600_22470 [Phytophthora cactorum]|nr:hypothetical protein GQ600_22470 [Phytophthora cactorum]